MLITYLDSLNGIERKVIFLDELPWMATVQSLASGIVRLNHNLRVLVISSLVHIALRKIHFRHHCVYGVGIVREAGYQCLVEWLALGDALDEVWYQKTPSSI